MKFESNQASDDIMRDIAKMLPEEKRGGWKKEKREQD
jgi:hypothetical protein